MTLNVLKWNSVEGWNIIEGKIRLVCLSFRSGCHMVYVHSNQKAELAGDVVDAPLRPWAETESFGRHPLFSSGIEAQFLRELKWPGVLEELLFGIAVSPHGCQPFDFERRRVPPWLLRVALCQAFKTQCSLNYAVLLKNTIEKEIFLKVWRWV